VAERAGTAALLRPRERASLLLLLDQFDAAVLRPPLFGVVRRDRRERPRAERPQPGRGNAVSLNERPDDGVRPVLGELEVAVDSADRIRMTTTKTFRPASPFRSFAISAIAWADSGLTSDFAVSKWMP